MKNKTVGITLALFIKGVLHLQGADVVFDASGHPSVAAELLRWLHTQGRAVIVGAYSPGLHGVDLLSVMFAEITIIGTRIYQRTDIEAAIELITAGKVDAHRLISKIYLLDDAVSAIDSLRRGKGMKVLIAPRPDTSEVINNDHR